LSWDILLDFAISIYELLCNGTL